MKRFQSFFVSLVACLAISLVGCQSDGFSADQVEALPDKQQLKLWPGDPPGEPTWEGDGPVPEMVANPRGGYRYVHEPVLDVFHAKGENRTGAAVVICPGGGYGMLAYQHEGYEIADWLNKNGITAVILRYRIFPYRHPVPMMDVQRAMQTVRANSKQWGVDPQRIGVLGFSAGGHLASTATVHHLAADPDSDDPVRRVTSRPDFSVLVYPVISMRDGVTHGGSKRNLLGKEPKPELVDLMSNDERINATTPPTILVHSKDDKVVLIENSERFLAGLKKNKIPGELVVFETGGHGYGLGRGRNDPNKTHETDAWPKQCIAWFGKIGVIDAGEPE